MHVVITATRTLLVPRRLALSVLSVMDLILASHASNHTPPFYRDRIRSLIATGKDPASERRDNPPMVVSLQVGVKKTDAEKEEDKRQADAAAAAAAAKKTADEEAARIAAIKLIPRRDSAEELRAAHRSVKIDLNIGGLDSIPDMPGLLSTPAPAPAPAAAQRKGLGFLAAYKKSNGLI